MTTRATLPVVEFNYPLDSLEKPLQDALDTLRSAIAHVADLLDVTLLTLPAGHPVVAAVSPGTTITAGRTAINTAEITADEARIIVQSDSGFAGSVQVYDVTNATIICTVAIPAALAFTIGAWTPVAPKGGDRQLELRVIGDGAATETLYAVHLQLRTTKFRP